MITMAEQALGVLLVVSLGIVGVILARAHPRAVFLLWAFVLVFVPYWVAVGGPLLVTVTVLMALFSVAVFWQLDIALRPMDVVVAGYVLLLLVAVLLGTGRPAEVVTFVTGPLVAYALGRTVVRSVPLSWIYTSLGAAFVMVSVVALVEYATGRNAFAGVGPMNHLHAIWAEQLTRGGHVRAEASFGSPIALGACIAMTVPLVWAAPWPVPWRAASVLVLLAGSVVTLSRIGMLTAFLAVLLMATRSVWRLPVAWAAGLLVALGPVAAIVVGAVGSVFEAAGAEASESANYRSQLRELTPSVRWLGVTTALFVRADGTRFFGPFKSIDSQIILQGMLSGILPLLLLLVPLAVAVVLTAQGKASSAMIAVVAQIPALLNVALVTQYGTYFWFMVGLAATVTAGRTEQALLLRQAPPERTGSHGPSGPHHAPSAPRTDSARKDFR